MAEISVIMSVYNNAPYLRESISSILEQTFSDFEFIIIDDASADNTHEILMKYSGGDSRIKVLANEINQGLAASLNKGLLIAKGKYISRHDADDISLPDRLKIQFDYLEKHPEIFLVGGSAIIVDDKGNHEALLSYPSDELTIKNLLPDENLIIHPSIMLRNDGKHFYREKFFYAQDYDFNLRLLTEGKRITNLADVLIKYRIDNIPILSKKHAQRTLFSIKAKEFYRQRLIYGIDKYDTFDMSSILNLDVHTTKDPICLRTFITIAFRSNRLRETRELIYRYWKYYGCWNKYILVWLSTFFGGNILNVLRKFTRCLKKNRFVKEIKAQNTPSKKKLSLLFTTGNGLWTWERIGTISRELALYKMLSNDGWDVTLFTYDRTRHLPPIGFDATVYSQWPFLFPYRLISLYQILFPLLHIFKRRKIALIITNQAHSGWPAILAGKLWKARVVARCGYVFGEMAQSLGINERQIEKKIRQERWTFKHADICIVPTKELSEWVISNYGLNTDCVKVIPNFVETNLFKPNDKIDKDIDVICIGRLDKVKRYDLVLEALSGLTVRALIIGNGPLKNELGHLINTNNMNIEILERVENKYLPEYLNKSKVYLNTSEWEGHPKALIEAMACGCACIVTKSPGLSNAIADGETGILIAPEPVCIRNAIKMLLDDDLLRTRLGKNARKYVLDNFSLENVYNQYNFILKNLVSK